MFIKCMLVRCKGVCVITCSQEDRCPEKTEMLGLSEAAVRDTRGAPILGAGNQTQVHQGSSICSELLCHLSGASNN